MSKFKKTSAFGKQYMIFKEKIFLFFLAVVLMSISVQSAAQETSASFTGGAIKVGYDNRSCDASLTGAIRYSSALKCPELCDGTDWKNTSCSNNYGQALGISENPCFGNGSGTCLFVTDSLSFYKGNLGGLSGADSKCAAEASGGGLTGTYKAILSTSTINAKDRFTVTYPVVNPHGLVIEDSDLWAGALESYPLFDQTGTPDWSTSVWTGSTAAGLKTANHCNNWTSDLSTDDGETGDAQKLDDEWLQYRFTDGCDRNNNLYCMLATGL